MFVCACCCATQNSEGPALPTRSKRILLIAQVEAMLPLSLLKTAQGHAVVSAKDHACVQMWTATMPPLPNPFPFFPLSLWS